MASPRPASAARDDRGLPLGLVHRDVSPSNLLVSRADGNITAAARLAELDRKHLRTLARRHGLLAGDDADE